jgi:hypothetical protein
MCVYYSVNYWYPTFLRQDADAALPRGIQCRRSSAPLGRLSETRLRRRGAVTITLLLGMASLPLYLHASDPVMLGLGALMMGAFGMGVWGMAPAYTTERYPTSVRGVGPGFCYHAGAAIGAAMPLVLGELQDLGFALENAATGMIVRPAGHGLILGQTPAATSRSAGSLGTRNRRGRRA